MVKYDAEDLRFAGVVENKVFIGPRNVALHITNACNLNCVYCCYHSNHNKAYWPKNKIELSFDRYRAVLDDCRNLKVSNVQLYGIGEPTMNVYISDMITYAKKNQFSVRLLTNGVFGEQLLPYVAMADEVCVNMSASNRDLYRLIHSQNAEDYFRIATDNLSYLCSIKTKKKLRVPFVKVNFVINSLNYKNLLEMFILAKKLKVDFLNIIVVNTTDFTKFLYPSAKMWKEIDSICLKMLKDRILYSVGNSIIMNYRRHKKAFSDRKEVNDSKACYLGWYHAYINLQGDVSPCCMINNYAPLIAGNIYDDKFADIWRSGVFSRIRARGKDGFFNKRLDACDHCCNSGLNQEPCDKLRRLDA